MRFWLKSGKAKRNAFPKKLIAAAHALVDLKCSFFVTLSSSAKHLPFIGIRSFTARLLANRRLLFTECFSLMTEFL